MSANNGNLAAKGSSFSFFFIPAVVLAAFALMFVGVIATLNHSQPLTTSIQTVLAGPTAPEEPEPAPDVVVAQSPHR